MASAIGESARLRRVTGWMVLAFLGAPVGVYAQTAAPPASETSTPRFRLVKDGIALGEIAGSGARFDAAALSAHLAPLLNADGRERLAAAIAGGATVTLAALEREGLLLMRSGATIEIAAIIPEFESKRSAGMRMAARARAAEPVIAQIVEESPSVVAAIARTAEATVDTRALRAALAPVLNPEGQARIEAAIAGRPRVSRRVVEREGVLLKADSPAIEVAAVLPELGSPTYLAALAPRPAPVRLAVRRPEPAPPPVKAPEPRAAPPAVAAAPTLLPRPVALDEPRRAPKRSLSSLIRRAPRAAEPVKAEVPAPTPTPIAQVDVLGLLTLDERPAALLAGEIRADPDTGFSRPFYTNREGRFALLGLTPGANYTILLDSLQTAFSLALPGEAAGLVRLDPIEAMRSA